MSPAVAVHVDVIINIAVELEGIAKVLRDRADKLKSEGGSLTMSGPDQASLGAAWMTVRTGLSGFGATPAGATPADAEAHTTAQLNSVLTGLQEINRLLNTGFN